MDEKLISFYEEQYHREVERREAMLRASTLPVGLTALIGALIFYALQPERIDGPVASLAVILSLYAVVILCAFFVLAYRFFLGEGYKRLPDADEWHSWHQQLRGHQETFLNAEKPKLTFQRELIETYVRCASHNKRENDHKSGLLYQMREMILISLAVSSFAAFLRMLHSHFGVL